MSLPLSCVPLFYICGYCYVQIAALLKVKDIKYMIFQHLDDLYTLLVFS